VARELVKWYENMEEQGITAGHMPAVCLAHETVQDVCRTVYGMLGIVVSFVEPYNVGLANDSPKRVRMTKRFIRVNECEKAFSVFRGFGAVGKICSRSLTTDQVLRAAAAYNAFCLLRAPRGAVYTSEDTAAVEDTAFAGVSIKYDERNGRVTLSWAGEGAILTATMAHQPTEVVERERAADPLVARFRKEREQVEDGWDAMVRHMTGGGSDGDEPSDKRQHLGEEVPMEMGSDETVTEPMAYLAAACEAAKGLAPVVAPTAPAPAAASSRAGEAAAEEEVEGDLYIAAILALFGGGDGDDEDAVGESDGDSELSDRE
jgi:hypothetical protein